MTLAWSEWVSATIGWPVVGWWLMAFVVVEGRAERRRKRMLREWGEGRR